MTARCVLLSSLLVPLLAVTHSSARSELPQAPEPREARRDAQTRAELLIGSWRLVKRTPPANPVVELTIEFTQDGKVTMWSNNPLSGRQIQKGTYSLSGSNLQMVIDPPHTPRERMVTIEVITADKLQVAGGEANDRQVHEFERTKRK